MSEGDVSLIRDEDVLRRMWQQTEDFSRKKEIRAHMYKLREERLRNLYSPEPPTKHGTGCEFTSPQGHVKSFADQTFQSMKSKEVRDAGSPPKEFTYRGQDLKELSNAGWNVESENRTTDDGHTHVKSVQATIEGRYDVDGGHGQFAARDQHTQAATEYRDDNTSLKRNESSSNTAASEQVVRQTDDGTHFSSTTSSSTSTSKVQQISSTKVSNESVPYITSDDYDRQTNNDNYRNEQSITKREVTNDYEQSLRRDVSDKGELVSRKIDYPDDNTKIVVETRLLPDGTRVTSTRREFRAPVVHSSRSEQHSQQTRSDTKSYKTSTQQTSDTKEFTSRIIHQNVEDQSTNIVDSQKNSDEHDFTRQIYHMHKDDTNTLREQTDRISQHATDNKDINKLISEDSQKMHEKVHHKSLNLNERSSEITRDEKTEKFSEKKVTSEQYQTTYNTDYTQKKISNDWSPTHQAWASTLRSETPTSTVPSTRASSPGARTYQSSTSSLRSSVSPDKMTRKPLSRGGSPSKVGGTHSPTRTSSDKYSSYSVSETKATQYTSPEGKPPHGRSPTRSSYSPEKSQRTSVSPDKNSKDSPRKSFPSPDRKTVSPENLTRQSFSPDMKYTSNNTPSESYPKSASPSKMQGKNNMPSPMRSNQSPTRVQEHENELNTRKLPTEPRSRSSASPEKKLPSSSPIRGFSPTKKTNPHEKQPTELQLRDVSPTKDYASSYVQNRSSPSPERKSNRKPDKCISDLPSTPRQFSSSPERKPGYMRPTAASQVPDSGNIKTVLNKSSISPDKKTPSTDDTQNKTVKEISKISNDNYTFIDEETKMYSRTDKENVEDYAKTTNTVDKCRHIRNKSPSPMHSVPSVDIPDYCQRESTPKPTLKKKSRSPSPSKRPVTFTDHINNTVETNKFTTIQTDNTNTNIIKDINTLPETQTSVKYDTYDKRHRITCSNNETIIPTTDINYDSLTRRETSPKKNSEGPSSPNKQSPRQSVSPVKPFGNDIHIKTTTDFITTEKTTEELNKKNAFKDRPRQLVTPSTSPTRKPKRVDTAPSTGQSSPTTSVSGFIYFGSPHVEQSIVTDLDEQESYIETTDLTNANISHERPKSLHVKRSPSPSKIPCRSPSPEKNISPTTENMPRKSSLKKPSVNNKSPTEKPPSNFRVSPTTEKSDHEHIIVKKDKPDKEDLVKTSKPKPPLERRETYEDRCRKILGMMDEDNKKTISKNKTSPSSTSPTYSKTDEKYFDYSHQTKTSKSQSSTNEFIKSEKETNESQDKSQHITKYPSRDSSPTKLQDIMSTNLNETSDVRYNTISRQEKNTSSETRENEKRRITHKSSIEKRQPINKVSRSSTSPDKKTDKEPSKKHSFERKPEQHENNKNSDRTSPYRTQPKQNASPDRQLKPQKLYTTNEELSAENNNVNVVKSSVVIRQETYDVDESQVLSESNLPREPKCAPYPSTNRSLPSRDIEEHKSRRSPSPKKTITSVIEKTEDLIVSEREQEILDRVQKSLRKLSPNRNEKSPTRGQSPSKTTSSIQNTEILTNVYVDTSEVTLHSENNSKNETNIDEIKCSQTKQKKTKEPSDGKSSKLPSRNTSPVKKTHGSVMVPESPNKSRNISPKKPILSVERPHSPQIQKTSGIKPRETVSSYSTKKPISPNKTEKTVITTDTKKTVTKQNSFTNKTSITTSKLNQTTTNKTNELNTKRATHKNQQNVFKKEPDSKVIRTASDTNIKVKKTSPQRMKSKPEIQIHNGSEVKTSKQTITVTRLSKPTITVHQSKLPSKPKSATTLNTSTDEDDIIIDVEQAKSSRENSPDRICPTPINFTDDVSTPRYPDEVNEPDDEFRQRTYNTIHETETIVDDIVEICEDDELFVKRNDNKLISEQDQFLLSVNDKVSNYTNRDDSLSKTKDTTKHFKDTEKRVHSDFIDENVKSDECLLTVSEKVIKFGKAPRDRDSKSPSRRIVDEYDKNTLYQDDYTKLSVNDKAHLFVETAENIKLPKAKTTSKIERPDLTDIDESLKSDDCLLSVSDKVNKFVKTAEQFLNNSQETNEKEKKIKEQHDIIMKKIIDDVDTDNYVSQKSTDENALKSIDTDHFYRKNYDEHTEKRNSFAKETASSHAKSKDVQSQNIKPNDKTPVIKITTLRSSEAVKKAKALFENIASTQKTIDTTKVKTTKLTDIGVIKKSPKTDSTIVLHPSLMDDSPNITDIDSEIDAGSEKRELQNYPTNKSAARSYPQPSLDKASSSPTNLMPHALETTRTKSPTRRTIETTTSKTISVSQPAQKAESPYVTRTEHEKTPQEQVPGYQRPTKTSQMKEETKAVEESEVSSRRGSGKFGVELRRTSVERSTTSSERRRSVEHHQSCIEDIYDLDLLEQMLEKVVGYEQRRRIRAQIRIAKKRMETNIDTHTRTAKHTSITVSKSKSPERRQTKSPERQPKIPSQETLSPDHQTKQTPQRTSCDRNQPKYQSSMVNGQAKEPVKFEHEPRHRPRSPEHGLKVHPVSKSPVRQPSPDKKTRTSSPSKTPTMKPKTNRFNEYATAYLKKAGVNETDKVKVLETKVKKSSDSGDRKTVTQVHENKMTETKSTISKSYTERTSSKDTIEVTRVHGKRTPSPEKKQSPERRTQTPTERRTETPAERLREKSPSPVIKRQLSDSDKKESITKTVHQIDKKLQPKRPQEEKPSWVTNRNLKKITSETRSFSSKKIENEKPKYRAPSPSKVIAKPIDVITSSYGPGPLDAEGKPLFGIKALRNGATNYQVKGTVIRQEFHSRNGGEPEGSVSVTAYSNSPEELERLLQCQGERPSRLHGLAAITTTKKFGGTTGNSYKDIHTKEERAALDRFTHSDRRVVDSKVEITDITSSDRTEERLQEIHSEESTAEDKGTRERPIQQERQEWTDKIERKERTEKMEKTERSQRREDKKTVRQSSVKSLTEKYIKNASEAPKPSSGYPKAGLILRTANMKDSVSSDSSVHAGLARTDSEHSLGSAEEVMVTSSTDRAVRTTSSTDRAGRTTTSTDRAVRTTAQTDRAGRPTTHVDRSGRTTVTTTTTTSRSRAPASFLDSSAKVTGVQDILTRMKNADIVIQEGDSSEDSEARALLNKFLGATVLMAGMQGYVTEGTTGKLQIKESVHSSSGKVTSNVEELDLDQCWDERTLRKLLDECTDTEQRRRLRARIRSLMAEQEACATAVTEALAAAGEVTESGDGDTREEEEVTTVTSSVRRNSSEKTISSSTTTKTTKVIESMTRPAPKPVSPFAKFRQLEKQNSINSPNSPKSPQSPGSPSQPLFKFTDPALQASALTIKERLLQWCRDKTRDYENVKLENFSTSWADGLAFCALLHHFLPEAFDYSKLTPEKRRHNFTLAFKVADEKAGIYPLLDVDDMVAMRKPDWKCVFTYVQSIHRRFKDQN